VDAATRRKYLAFGGAAVLSLLADQLSKAWARAELRGHPPLVVVADYFDLAYAENRGIAFSLLHDHAYTRLLVPVIGLAALGVILLFVRRAPAGRTLLAACLGLLAGGALGNIIDRVAFAAVTDFVVWKAPLDGSICRAIGWVMARFGAELRYCQWATFNVADAALLVGAAGLLLDARQGEASGRPS